MDRPNTIQLPVQDYEPPDYKNCRLKPEPGIVVVEMFPQQESIGSILLPDQVKDKLQPDAGTVIASGHEDYKPGDAVLVFPYNGTWFRGWTEGYKAKGEVRIYGVGSQTPEERIKRGAGMDIPAVLTDKIQAKGSWVLIKRDPVVQASGLIELPDEDQYRPGTATVVSAGDLSGFSEGERICYHGNAVVTNLEFLDRLGFEDHKDYVFIHKDNIYLRIEAAA